MLWYMPANGNDIMNKAMTLAADVECCLNVIRNTTLLGAIASFKCVCLNRPFKINIIMFRVFLFFFLRSLHLEDVLGASFTWDSSVWGIKYINYGLKWRKWFVWFAVRDRIGWADLLYMASLIVHIKTTGHVNVFTLPFARLFQQKKTISARWKSVCKMRFKSAAKI